MLSRRDFLQRAALLSGGLGTFAVIPQSILKAMNIEPDAGTTFMDAEHVVILMQENRSFDHAFGTLRGVRGFNDPRAISLPGGNPVWLQTDAGGETFAPFGLNIRESKATWMQSLPHSRSSQVAAHNEGRHDHWLRAKPSGNKEYAGMPLTLGFYDRQDIPFYYAFADAFTVCDHYFCSAQTCTTPNRSYLWTGTSRYPGSAGTVCMSNSQLDHASDPAPNWTTFPERLEDHGVSWKIYQNEIDLTTGFKGAEDGWLGNFGDNPMEYFTQYQVEFYPPHRAHMEKRLAELKQKQAEPVKPIVVKAAAPKPGATPEEIAAATEKAAAEKAAKEKAAQEATLKLAAEIEKLTARLETYSAANFAKLSPRDQRLHQRAFTTNTGDPDQHKLETLKYTDGATSREVQVPAGDLFHQFREDVNTGKLPTVSWLVAPENFSDHPAAPWYGAWYVSEVLDILTKNPAVWKKTIFILTYDENDGYFDHLPPFVPPHTARPESGAATAGLDTALEFDERGHPIGLGFRVPMVIASPWTRGGQVCSQVFDHTSVLQFLEIFLANKSPSKIEETNIHPWRRLVCGDLTSAFNPHLGTPARDLEALKRDEWVQTIHKARYKGLPSGFKSLTDEEISLIRGNPAQSPLMPKQEPGGRPSCALPYVLHAHGSLDRQAGTFTITFQSGDKESPLKTVGAPFQVYAPGRHEAAASPATGTKYDECRRWSFAVAAGDSVRYSWPLPQFEKETYHLRAYGPNGFLREFAGGMDDPNVTILSGYEVGAGKATGRLWFDLANHGTAPAIFALKDNAYGSPLVTKGVAPGQTVRVPVDLTRSFRWYDLTVLVQGSAAFGRRFAGRVETGEPGHSDPLLGGMLATAGREDALPKGG